MAIGRTPDGRVIMASPVAPDMFGLDGETTSPALPDGRSALMVPEMVSGADASLQAASLAEAGEAGASSSRNHSSVPSAATKTKGEPPASSSRKAASWEGSPLGPRWLDGAFLSAARARGGGGSDSAASSRALLERQVEALEDKLCRQSTRVDWQRDDWQSLEEGVTQLQTRMSALESQWSPSLGRRLTELRSQLKTVSEDLKTEVSRLDARLDTLTFSASSSLTGNGRQLSLCPGTQASHGDGGEWDTPGEMEKLREEVRRSKSRLQDLQTTLGAALPGEFHQERSWRVQEERLATAMSRLDTLEALDGGRRLARLEDMMEASMTALQQRALQAELPEPRREDGIRAELAGLDNEVRSHASRLQEHEARLVTTLSQLRSQETVLEAKVQGCLASSFSRLETFEECGKASDRRLRGHEELLSALQKQVQRLEEAPLVQRSLSSGHDNLLATLQQQVQRLEEAANDAIGRRDMASEQRQLRDSEEDLAALQKQVQRLEDVSSSRLPESERRLRGQEELLAALQKQVHRIEELSLAALSLSPALARLDTLEELGQSGERRLRGHEELFTTLQRQATRLEESCTEQLQTHASSLVSLSSQLDSLQGVVDKRLQGDDHLVPLSGQLKSLQAAMEQRLRDALENFVAEQGKVHVRPDDSSEERENFHLDSLEARFRGFEAASDRYLRQQGDALSTALARLDALEATSASAPSRSPPSWAREKLQDQESRLNSHLERLRLMEEQCEIFAGRFDEVGGDLEKRARRLLRAAEEQSQQRSEEALQAISSLAAEVSEVQGKHSDLLESLSKRVERQGALLAKGGDPTPDATEAATPAKPRAVVSVAAAGSSRIGEQTRSGGCDWEALHKRLQLAEEALEVCRQRTAEQRSSPSDRSNAEEHDRCARAVFRDIVPRMGELTDSRDALRRALAVLSERVAATEVDLERIKEAAAGGNSTVRGAIADR